MVPIQKILPFFAIFGIILAPVGMYFSCKTETNSICTRGMDRIKIIDSKIVDYTNCVDSIGTPCRVELLKDRHKQCQCSIVDFTLNSSLAGEVIVFHQLDSFNGASIYNDTNYTLSRDDKQLLGNLTNAPSKSCIPYAYGDDNRPIVPCGEIADAMFTDKLKIFDLNGETYTYVPSLLHGIVSDADKKNYHNPPNSSEDLVTVFDKYSRPKSWDFPISDLDPANSSNNGFQNEPFIAWMSAKDPNGPIAAWRVDRNNSRYKDGLPIGKYSLIVNYTYHPRRYSGPRKAIIASTEHEYDPDNCSSTTTHNHFGLGISILIIGIIFLLISVVAVVYGIKTNWGKGEVNIDAETSQRPSSANENDTEQTNEDGKPLQKRKYQITDDKSATSKAAILTTSADD